MQLPLEVTEIITGWVDEFRKYEELQLARNKSLFDLVMCQLYISGGAKNCKNCDFSCLRRRHCCWNFVCEHCAEVCSVCDESLCPDCTNFICDYEPNRCHQCHYYLH